MPDASAPSHDDAVPHISMDAVSVTCQKPVFHHSIMPPHLNNAKIEEQSFRTQSFKIQTIEVR